MAGQESRATSLEPGWVDGVLMEQRLEAERTRSLGPDSRRRAVAQSKGATSRRGTLPADLRRKKAVVNQDVDPCQFASLRRGFTLNGQPIPQEATLEKMAIIKVKEEGSAYFFWAIFITLALLALGNLVTTLVIVNVLRVGPAGMEALDFLPGGRGVRLFGAADLGEIHKLDGIISSFASESLTIAGDGGRVVVSAGPGDKAPTLTLTPEHVTLENVHDFSVVHPDTGEVLFSTSDPELQLPEGLERLEAEEVEVERITAPLGEDLRVRSDANLVIRGAEGVELGGSSISLSSAKDIILRSEVGSIELSGGVMLDSVMLPHGGGGYEGEIGQFKLCVCMPSGTLFKVTLPNDNPSRPLGQQVGCHSVDLTVDNPCHT